MSVFVLFCALISTVQAAILSSTDVRFYPPFEQKYKVATLAGTCTRHSALDNRSDAWQCRTDQRVLDPCFIKTYVKAKTAICPISPWQNEAIQVKLISPVLMQNSNEQEELDMSEDDPWAINLVDGAHCLKLQQDQTFTVIGQPVKYACDNQGFLLGHIQRCDLVWKMLFLPSRNSQNLNMIEINTAWY